MALFRGIQEYIALFDSGNIVNIYGNIFLYPPQGHPILYSSYIVLLQSPLRNNGNQEQQAIILFLAVQYYNGNHTF